MHYADQSQQHKVLYSNIDAYYMYLKNSQSFRFPKIAFTATDYTDD